MGEKKINSADLKNYDKREKIVKDFYSAPAEISKSECVWCLGGSYDEIDYIEEKLSNEGKYMASKMGIYLRNRYNKPGCKQCNSQRSSFDLNSVVENILSENKSDSDKASVQSATQAVDKLASNCDKQTDQQPQSAHDDDYRLLSSTEELRRALSIPDIRNKKIVCNSIETLHLYTNDQQTSDTKQKMAKDVNDPVINDILQGYKSDDSAMSQKSNTDNARCFLQTGMVRQSRLDGLHKQIYDNATVNDSYYIVNKIKQKPVKERKRKRDSDSVTQESSEQNTNKTEEECHIEVDMVAKRLKDETKQLDLMLKIASAHNYQDTFDERANENYRNTCDIIPEDELEKLEQRLKRKEQRDKQIKAQNSATIDTMQMPELASEEEINKTIIENLPNDVESESQVLREVESDIEMKIRESPFYDPDEKTPIFYSASANKQANMDAKGLADDIELEIESEIEKLCDSSLSEIKKNIETTSQKSLTNSIQMGNEDEQAGIQNLEEEKIKTLKLVTAANNDSAKNISLINPCILQEIINSHKVGHRVNKMRITPDGKEVVSEVENDKQKTATPAKEAVDTAVSSVSAKKFDELTSADQKAKIQSIKSEAEERLGNTGNNTYNGPQSLKYIKRIVLQNKDKCAHIDDVVSINDLKIDTIYGKIQKKGHNDIYQKNWFQLKDIYLTCYNSKKNKMCDDIQIDEKNGDMICPDNNQYYLTKKYCVNLRLSMLHLVLNPTNTSLFLSKLTCKFLAKKKTEELVHLFDKNIKNVLKIGQFYKVYIKNADGSETVYSVPYLELLIKYGDEKYNLRFDTISNFLKWILAFELRQQKIFWPIT